MPIKRKEFVTRSEMQIKTKQTFIEMINILKDFAHRWDGMVVNEVLREEMDKTIKEYGALSIIISPNTARTRTNRIELSVYNDELGVVECHIHPTYDSENGSFNNYIGLDKVLFSYSKFVSACDAKIETLKIEILDLQNAVVKLDEYMEEFFAAKFYMTNIYKRLPFCLKKGINITQLDFPVED